MWSCCACLRRLSSPKPLTRNRLKPVQTGRFHLGLVFSRWRRVKFGLGSRPCRVVIGRGVAEDSRVASHWLVGLPVNFNSLKRPRDRRRERGHSGSVRTDLSTTPRRNNAEVCAPLLIHTTLMHISVAEVNCQLGCCFRIHVRRNCGLELKRY